MNQSKQTSGTLIITGGVLILLAQFCNEYYSKYMFDFAFMFLFFGIIPNVFPIDPRKAKSIAILFAFLVFIDNSSLKETHNLWFILIGPSVLYLLSLGVYETILHYFNKEPIKKESD